MRRGGPRAAARGLAWALLLAPWAGAQQGVGAYAPLVHADDGSAQAAAANLRAAAGARVELWAGEPRLANAVCLEVDARGRVYVGESFRVHAGVTDIREHDDWLDDDLASLTVADRIALHRKWEGEAFAELSREHDRLRLLVDEDGDGRADRDVVFADGFNAPEAGIGAGVLAVGDEVYYACIPSLWRLRDLDGDGRADERAELATGFGVRIAFLGHDLHGLTLGPDGRLYFSIGDRGFHVEHGGRTLASPDRGAVLRCELDGSDLTVVHTGLRNPQELAFDDFGNLFTGDNNADGGDLARWVAIVEGGDSGWRQPYQFLPDRGPWKDERLWEQGFAEQAAYIVPPVDHLASGPSGLSFHPGSGRLPEFAGHFVLCDFTGGADSSAVLAFTSMRRGAWFERGPARRVLGGLLPTDASFAPDGSLFVSDWVEGWGTTGRGRIWRVVAEGEAGAEDGARTAELLAAPLAGLTEPVLGARLAHADRRVRLAAQLELARRGAPGIAVLVNAARHGASLVERLHGAWGVGIAARREPAQLVPLEALAADPVPELRATFAKLAGQSGGAAFGPAVVALLGDEDPWVRCQAALAAGALGARDASAALVALLAEAGDEAPLLRHAAIMGLAGCASDAELEALLDHELPAVRRGLAVVWRRQGDARLAALLDDEDELVVLEAARAIHDLPVPAALEALASRLVGPPSAEEEAHEAAAAARPGAPGSETAFDVRRALLRRQLSANLLVGDGASARRLMRFASRPGVEPALRVEALEILARWREPGVRDLVTGAHRALPPRASAELPALAAELERVGIAHAPDEVAAAFCAFVESAGAEKLHPLMSEWAADRARGGASRVAALRALGAIAPARLAGRIDGLLADADPDVRAAALEALEELDEAAALARVPSLLEAGELPERRTALRIAARSDDPAARAAVAAELDRLQSGLSPEEAALDVVLAAEALVARGGGEELSGRLSRRGERAQIPPELRPFLDGLVGGDRGAGREVFERASLSCLRCHRRGDEDDAPRVGPDLAGVGRRLARVQLLQSIVLPNLRLAPGYGTENVFLRGGGVISGRVVRDDAGLLSLVDAEGIVHDLDPAEVELRRAGLSAMPEELAAQISREEMRDLIEYLAGL